ATRQVQVGHALVAQDAKSVKALGREVDAPVVWSRGVEEDVLCPDKLPEGLVQFRVELGHLRTPHTKSDFGRTPRSAAGSRGRGGRRTPSYQASRGRTAAAFCSAWASPLARD